MHIISKWFCRASTCGCSPRLILGYCSCGCLRCSLSSNGGSPNENPQVVPLSMLSIGLARSILCLPCLRMQLFSAFPKYLDCRQSTGRIHLFRLPFVVVPVRSGFSPIDIIDNSSTGLSQEISRATQVCQTVQTAEKAGKAARRSFVCGAVPDAEFRHKHSIGGRQSGGRCGEGLVQAATRGV